MCDDPDTLGMIVSFVSLVGLFIGYWIRLIEDKYRPK